MSNLTPPRDEPQNEPTGEAVTAAARPRKRRRGLVIGAVAAASVAAATLVVLVVLQPTAIERAGEACAGTKPLQKVFDEASSTSSPKPDDDSENDSEFTKYFEGVISVEDGGKSLIVNTMADDEDILGVSSLALDCVYEELDVPTYVSENIGQTRALDGRQNTEWDGFSASWSYHPDDGANVIFVQK
jgi:hypothetical protein